MDRRDGSISRCRPRQQRPSFQPCTRTYGRRLDGVGDSGDSMSIESRRELELTRTKLELLEDRLTAPRPRTRRESPRPRMVGSLAQTNHQSNERRNRPFREPLQGRCPEILNPPTVACHPALGVPTRPAAFRTKPNENALRVWTWLAQLRMSPLAPISIDGDNPAPDEILYDVMHPCLRPFGNLARCWLVA